MNEFASPFCIFHGIYTLEFNISSGGSQGFVLGVAIEGVE